MATHPVRVAFATGNPTVGAALATATGAPPDTVPADMPVSRTGGWSASQAQARESASAINPGFSRDTVLTWMH